MALGLIVSGLLAVGSAVLGNQAKQDRKGQAGALNEIRKIKNKQERRRFLRTFRQQQAAAILTGVASGADPASSRGRGTAASQATQAEVAIFESEQQERLGAVASELGAKASSGTQTAGLLSTGSAFAASSGGQAILDPIGKKIGIGG